MSLESLLHGKFWVMREGGEDGYVLILYKEPHMDPSQNTSIPLTNEQVAIIQEWMKGNGETPTR